MKINVNQIVIDAETFFNTTNSLPVVAVLGALARETAAKIQFFSAAFFAVRGFIGHQIEPSNERWKFIQKEAGEHMLHGILNFIRSIGELLLAVTLIGSLISLHYQIHSKNGFAPIIHYNAPVIQQFKNLMRSPVL